MRIRTTWTGVAVVALVALAAPATAKTNLLINGNFEDAPNPDAATNTFAGWNETAPTGGTPGAAGVRATTALSGIISSRLLASPNGTLTPSVPAAPSQYQLDVDFAALAPLDNNADRTLNIILPGSGGQINLRLVRPAGATTGNVQVFSSPLNAFQTILTGAVNFSPDLGTPVVNHLRLAADYSDPTAANRFYEVTVNGQGSGPEVFFQNGTPSNLTRVDFTTVNGTNVSYVIDNVTLTPEPAAAGLLAVGAVGLLARRRRA